MIKFIKTENELIPINQIRLIQKTWFFGKCIDIWLTSAPFDHVKCITIWKRHSPEIYDRLLNLGMEYKNLGGNL